MDIHECGNASSGIVLIQPVGEDDTEYIEKEIDEIHKKCDTDFLLATFSVSDWNKELSPWKAKAVFGKEDLMEKHRQKLEMKQ